MRLFIALPVPDEIADMIARIQTGIKGARWSPRQNLHITLRFMGQSDARTAQELDGLLGAIALEPFELSASGVDHFEAKNPYALWVRVAAHPSLTRLHKACERACRQAGFDADPRQYRPHITICYLPSHQTIEPIIAFEQNHNLFKTPPWTADRFYLYSSQTSGEGPSQYRIEAEYPLVHRAVP